MLCGHLGRAGDLRRDVENAIWIELGFRLAAKRNDSRFARAAPCDIDRLAIEGNQFELLDRRTPQLRERLRGRFRIVGGEIERYRAQRVLNVRGKIADGGPSV